MPPTTGDPNKDEEIRAVAQLIFLVREFPDLLKTIKTILTRLESIEKQFSDLKGR